jgi:hypothetical protein
MPRRKRTVLDLHDFKNARGERLVDLVRNPDSYVEYDLPGAWLIAAIVRGYVKWDREEGDGWVRMVLKRKLGDFIEMSMNEPDFYDT